MQFCFPCVGLSFKIQVSSTSYASIARFFTFSTLQMAWLKGKMGRLDSIRSNRSISSSSTYIYGMGGRKQFHKSQLSLYDKISRKISLGRPASRKSSQSHSQVGFLDNHHMFNQFLGQRSRSSEVPLRHGEAKTGGSWRRDREQELREGGDLRGLGGARGRGHVGEPAGP